MFIHAGNGHYINKDHILFVVMPNIASTVRTIRKARTEGRLYDFTKNFPTKGVVVLDTGDVIRIAKRPKDFVSADEIAGSVDNTHQTML